MKLERIARQRKNSRGNDERFYTQLDMAIIKHDAAVRNAQVKRGEVPRISGVGFNYVSVCGCGREGCFIHG